MSTRFVLYCIILLLILTGCNRKSEEEQIKEGMDEAKKELTTRAEKIQNEKSEEKISYEKINDLPQSKDKTIKHNGVKIKILKAKLDSASGQNAENKVNITFIIKNDSDRDVTALSTFQQNFEVFQLDGNKLVKLDAVSTSMYRNMQNEIQNQNEIIVKNKTVKSVITFQTINVSSNILIKSKHLQEKILLKLN
ncbi:hypothetical protein ERX37_04640 [Macrococcus hajekii]|uniref:DUF5067 domain-containing protein n=1 Tax=Macrococcus hajekii TaxID=198482 RepID=A0A4V3BEA7_9STAP|nr:hypothetical protein [Macrococcus hajekii]TDM03375.1 hypothetical protein ERX37_04640 [Macrococcus hajekii]GGA98340.1 hypothetical protein GCM10007190_02930 [Macrococcus hajekii]